jgi:acetyl-CoA carboxylase biotin carboxyl carrier protein
MTSIFDRVAELAAWVEAADIDVLVLKGPEGALRLERSADGGVTRTRDLEERTAGVASRDNAVVRAALAGTFLTAHPLRAEPLAPAGDRVVAGQTLGLIRIGDLLAPVCAPADGVVDALLAEDGALVGFGDPLFALAQD